MACAGLQSNPRGLEQGRSASHHHGMLTDLIPPEDLRGKLLIAMPGLGDPRFDHTVILICAHSADGAMGLIVNKTLGDVSFADLLNQVGIDAGPRPTDRPVHYGGPVEQGRGFVLQSAEKSDGDGTVAVTDTITLSATLDILESVAHGSGPKRALVALGYAGWAPGQLEQELQANGWLVGDAADALVFGEDQAQKWQSAIRALGIDPVMLSASGGRA